MKSLFLDTLREIKHSFGRFISILIIVALGCGFFCGLKITMSDMQTASYEYFRQNNLMDMRLMSSIGIKSEDVEAVRNAENVTGAYAGYSKDVMYNYDDSGVVLKLMSYNPKTPVNTPVVIEGRLPQKSGECVVEKKISSPTTFEIGNKLTFYSPNDENILDSLKTDTYEIVGIVTSPLYIGYQRDASTIGNGTVVSNVMIPEEDFIVNYYYELFLTLDGVGQLDPFSEEYKEKVNSLAQPAINAFENSVSSRYEKLKSDADKQMTSANEKTEMLSGILEMQDDELNDYYKQVRTEYGKAKKEYDEYDDKNSAEALISRAKYAKLQSVSQVLSEVVQSRNNGSTSADDKYSEQIRQANNQIETAKQQLNELGDVIFVHSDRFELTDYSSYKSDTEKIDSIAKVFPAFFIIIAVLVCITTMTRMVEDCRTEIGTYKALGYTDAAILTKYLVYSAAATIPGAVIGTIIGMNTIPVVIFNCYKIMYNIPDIALEINGFYIIMCILVSLVCICGSVTYCCFSVLKSNSAELMRPKAPKKGKRVLLESIPFIWNKISFLQKCTIRNLFRYKRRFFMTVFGIAGCTALMMTGFGLKYSISQVGTRQFSEIFKYDAAGVCYEIDKGKKILEENSEVKEFLPSTLLQGTASAESNQQSVHLITCEDMEKFPQFINLININSGQTCEVNDNSVVITQKLAMLLKLKEGDSFTLVLTDKKPVELTVSEIAQNYALHYIVISPSYYKQLYGEQAEFNTFYINLKDGTNHNDFAGELISDSEFLGVSFSNDIAESFYNSMKSLDSVIALLIFCAGLLAMIVLYNLANINITERYREIATLKVLGFYDGETAEYIYRENIISTLIGIVSGGFMGLLFHYFVVITAETDTVMFYRHISFSCFVYSALLTILFAVIVNIVLYFKLKKIDMVSSLKSVE